MLRDGGVIVPTRATFVASIHNDRMRNAGERFRNRHSILFPVAPRCRVCPERRFAVNRAFDGIFLALFIEKYVAAQQSGHETGFFLGMFFGIHDERFSICWMIWFLAVLMSCFYLSENVTSTIIRAAMGGLGQGLACLMAWRAASSREA